MRLPTASCLVLQAGVLQDSLLRCEYASRGCMHPASIKYHCHVHPPVHPDIPVRIGLAKPPAFLLGQLPV